MYNSLIILGNGFDLQCGLNTRYKDFSNWLNEHDKNYKENFSFVIDHINRFNDEIPCYGIFNANNLPKINFWVMHFLRRYLNYNHFYDKWVDVEKEIYEVIVNYEEYLYKFKSSLNKRKIYGDIKHPIYYNAQEYLLIKNILHNKNDLIEITDNESNNEKIFLEWLFKELNEFESKFAEFILDEVNNKNEIYIINAEKLLKRINGNVEPITVLNFNYTDPLQYLSKDWGKCISRNIHGLAEKTVNGYSKIIFGIDKMGLTNEKSNVIHRFTKSSRISFIEYQDKFSYSPEIKSIKFYGHSLNKSDYSYFYTIFDHYGINETNNEIKLEFYYTEYADTDAKNIQIKNDYASSVYNLLDIYGQEKRIAYLQTRLKNENRLVIKQI